VKGTVLYVENPDLKEDFGSLVGDKYQVALASLVNPLKLSRKGGGREETDLP